MSSTWRTAPPTEAEVRAQMEKYGAARWWLRQLGARFEFQVFDIQIGPAGVDGLWCAGARVEDVRPWKPSPSRPEQLVDKGDERAAAVCYSCRRAIRAMKGEEG